MKKIDMEEAFRTLPEVPKYFEEYCKNTLSIIPIFYKRGKKYSDCLCGRCARTFVTDIQPERHRLTKCLVCGNTGKWEWSKVTTRHLQEENITLIQCTTDKNLVVRIFRVYQSWQQGCEAKIEIMERRRYFLHMGDVYKFYNSSVYTCQGWKRQWGTMSDHEAVNTDELYPGWETEIKKSNLKYCDPLKIANASRWYADNVKKGIIDILVAYANNPAIEMYAKVGMQKLTQYLLAKEGKTKLINRRSKTPLGQLRIKDKAAFNRLVKENGDTDFLEILQLEKKKSVYFTPEQEQFMLRIIKTYKGRETLNFLLQYMSIQKLINRVAKYIQQKDYTKEQDVIRAYKDYLEMRKELEYDMTNEVYLYPKNLKEKHDQMVKERETKRNKDYIATKMEEFSKIQSRYKTLSQKYTYEDLEYVIRPAKDAGEIIMEGRTLHHCVGGDNYLRKHNKGETSILFLRRKETPDIPYYTIEIRENHILQWYGERDKKPDKEIIGPWLDNYMERLNTPEELLAVG